MIFVVLLNSFLLIFILSRRFVSLKKILVDGRNQESHAGSDVSAQLFFFIKSLTQKSLCPSSFERRYPKASLYYPLGIYWVATNIALLIKQTDRRPITYSNLKDPEHYSSLALKIVLLFNIFLLPVISIFSIGILPFIVIPNILYASLVSMFAMIYAELFFPFTPYTVQTRTIGFCLSYILCSSLIILLYLKFNPLAFDFTQELDFFNSNLSLKFLFRVLIYSLSITSLGSLLFIAFRSAQQGSQFIISMLITLCILMPQQYIIPTLSSIFLALCYSFSQLSLDSSNFFRAHWNNRLHDSSWYIRTYGQQKYKFLQLKYISSWNYLSSLFSFDIEPSSGSRHGIYKSSWSLQLIENRSFIYSLILSVFLSSQFDALNSEPSVSIILFTTISCLAPCILCCTRFLQGYGPPLHYIDFFTPFNYIAIFTVICNLDTFITPDWFKFIIIADLCICLIRLLIFSIQKDKFFFQKNLLTSNNRKDESLLSSFLSNEEKLIIDYIHNIKFSDFNSGKTKLAAARAGHYQMIIEVSCFMASNQFKDSKREFYRDLIAFPYVDSSSYSFYDDWNWILTMPSSLKKKEVTHLFINLNDKAERTYFKKYLKYEFGSNYKLFPSNTDISLVKFSY